VTPDAGLLLTAALVGFYLQDSAHLLYADEVVVTGERRGWRFELGSLELGGRYLHLPNPFLPAHPIFRANWLAAGQGSQRPSAELSTFLADVAPLGRCCAALSGLLLLVLPAAVFAYRVPMLLMAIVAVAYALIGLMLVLLLHRRDRLGMSARDVAAIATDALLCPPHAINLLRKVCLWRGLRDDPLVFAAGTLPAEARSRLRNEIEGRADLIAASGDLVSPRGPAMRARLAQVREMLP
jgi:hypothetical protein